MTYRPDREKGGFLEVYYRDTTYRRIPRNEWEPLTMALRAGQPWYDTTNLSGIPVLIRLSEVIDVADVTAADVKKMDEEQEERAQYKKTHGGDDD